MVFFSSMCSTYIHRLTDILGHVHYIVIWRINVCSDARRGHGHGDAKEKKKPILLIISPAVSQQTLNTELKKKKGNYSRQEEEKQQFWQSCADNFPRADLAKQATSVELQRQPLGCLGCFSFDVLQLTLCRQRNLVCSAHCNNSDPSAQARRWILISKLK